MHYCVCVPHLLILAKCERLDHRQAAPLEEIGAYHHDGSLDDGSLHDGSDGSLHGGSDGSLYAGSLDDGSFVSRTSTTPRVYVQQTPCTQAKKERNKACCMKFGELEVRGRDVY